MKQPALDFAGPAQPETVYQRHDREFVHDLVQEQTRRRSTKDRVLIRLRRGPATNVELSQIALRFGARLMELRAEGYDISTVPLAGGLVRYTLHD